MRLLNIQSGDVRKFTIRMLVSLAASVVIVFVLYRHVLGVKEGLADQVIFFIRNISPWYLALFALLNLAQAAVRATRYRLLIASGNTETPPAYSHTLLVTLARNMFVDMFPARAGELSYIVMMQAGYKVSAQACLSSLMVSFIFDILALACLVLALFAMIAFSGSSAGLLLKAFLIIALLSGLLFLFVYKGIGLAANIIRSRASLHKHHAIIAKLIELIEKTAIAVKNTAGRKIFAPTLLLSLLVRICKYLGLYFLFVAVVLTTIPQYVNVPLYKVVSAFLSGEAMTSLPLPVFLGFGSYEAGGTTAFVLAGISAAHAGLVILVSHIVSQVFDYIAGLIALVFMILKVNAPIPADSPKRGQIVRNILPFGLIIICFAVLIMAINHVQDATEEAGAPPEAGVNIAPLELTDLAEKKNVLPNGFVVWSSNRSGNHEIHMLSLPGLQTRQLTRNNHVDYFPRISPDGSRVVFARSKVKWVSQRNAVPWDIYVIDLQTGIEELLAADANCPTWSRDGKHVYFCRKGVAVMAISPETKRETTIFSISENESLEFCTIQTPSISCDGTAIAMTFRGAHRFTGIVSSGAVKRTGSGCQLVWVKDGESLCFVDDGGKLKNAFYIYSTVSGTTTKWHDNPGAYSHEYFPMISEDGAYLVYGASTGGHEHDRADYEIFIWNTAESDDKAVRLTYHTGNDCWPDIFISKNPRID